VAESVVGACIGFKEDRNRRQKPQVAARAPVAALRELE
jgi:hypothetical protein